MKARALMIGGTASHVGKSWMATAICRFLARAGYRVAPFKAQNMSNNSYPCRTGGEIGRAQVEQAFACFLQPEPDMNPILLKPDSDTGSQVVVNGRMWKNLSAREYYDHFPFLLEQVINAYQRLAARYEFIVIEGAGSIAELNLKQTDLVNLGLATRIHAPVLLVADIDKGGVFASLAGTFALLEENERSLVRGFAVNRFRGDPSLFQSGVDILEARTGKPCLGVFPYLQNVMLDAEDAVSLERRETSKTNSSVAILRFPHISNFSDFRLLPTAQWVTQPMAGHFDYIILPGTKNTIGDLLWMRSVGLDQWVLQQHRAGAHIIGVCGGYQMMGESIEDPLCLESGTRQVDGLRLLRGQTRLNSQKTTRAVQGITPSGHSFEGYEIHLGQTVHSESAAQPFATLSDGCTDGIRLERCTGTYLHGALENAAVLSELLKQTVSAAPSRDAVYEKLADWFESNIDRHRFEELYLCG